MSDVQTAPEADQREAEIVVSPTEQLTTEEIQAAVGAKNVMGTCSG